jgi:UDP-N-acetyl-D-mannosaminuronic acid dehydrogenase
MKVSVIGLGYIGLPTAVAFAKFGINVVGVDISHDIVEAVNTGGFRTEEPGLETLIKEVVASGTFRAALAPEEADVFIIAVPTPNMNDEYKSCDLSFVSRAVQQVLPHVRTGNTIIIESTLAPRSMDDHVKPLVESAGLVIGRDVYLVHCPERVMPGKIMYEIVHNDRIVGGITDACTDAGAEVYGLFVKGEIIKTIAKNAEMCKVVENTFRDVNIALANELTKVCNNLEINVLEVIEMANKHPRVNLHQPGPGVGGHCLAVDPYFILSKAPEMAQLISLSRETNRGMPQYVVDNVCTLVQGIEGPKIAVFGAAYKTDTDDIRESPAMDVIQLLIHKGYGVTIHDPHVKTLDPRFVSLEEATEGAHLLLVLTDHSEFKRLNYQWIVRNMERPLVFDTRNCVSVSVNSGLKVINFGNLYNAV